VTMVTTVVDGDLEEITRSIWSTLFELTLARADGWHPGGDPTVTSVVRIDGAWHGAVVFRCPMALAAGLTAAMFRGDGEPSEDDVRDALGELANMMAGNVKALLPEPCGISLPSVAFGRLGAPDVPGGVPVATAAFTCAGHPLVVALVRGTRESTPE